MTDSQNYVPEGYSVVTPSLTVSDADKAIAFYREVFGATVLPTRLADSKGAVYFLKIAIGDSRVMITDEVAGNVSPESLGGSPVRLVIYVSDVDAVMERAVAAGRYDCDSCGGPILWGPLREAARSLRVSLGRSDT